MAQLEWSDALVLDLAEMDHTHHEFVDLLARVETAPDDSVVHHWAELITHTEAHFGQEDAWMRDTGFSSSNCHSLQHKVVLQVMREGLRNGHEGARPVDGRSTGPAFTWHRLQPVHRPSRHATGAARGPDPRLRRHQLLRQGAPGRGQPRLSPHRARQLPAQWCHRLAPHPSYSQRQQHHGRHAHRRSGLPPYRALPQR